MSVRFFPFVRVYVYETTAPEAVEAVAIARREVDRDHARADRPTPVVSPNDWSTAGKLQRVTLNDRVDDFAVLPVASRAVTK